MVVDNPLIGAFHAGQFMVMCGKQGARANPAPGGILNDGTGDAHTVKGGSAAPNLVVNNQTFARSAAQNGRHLGHFQHESGLPGCQVVGRAHAGKYPVCNPDVRGGCRNEGADLRHQHNQCDLPHIGGFTCHIGTCYQHETVVAGVQIGVVGNKVSVLDKLLHHGMPPVPDADAVILHNLGTDIPVARCHRRKAPVHVRLCQQGGSFLDALAPVCDKTPQLAEQLVLQCAKLVLCAQDSGFHVLQLLRDVALCADQRLLAYVVGGYLIGKGLGYLYVVAEHLVVANLQRLDTGTCLFLGGNPINPSLPVVHDGAQTIHFVVIAVRDHAALAYGEGRLLNQCAPDLRADILQHIHLPPDALEFLALAALQQTADIRQNRCGGAHGAQILAPRCAEHDTRDEPLHVQHVRKQLTQLLPLHIVPDQFLHRTLPAGNVRGR